MRLCSYIAQPNLQVRLREPIGRRAVLSGSAGPGRSGGAQMDARRRRPQQPVRRPHLVGQPRGRADAPFQGVAAGVAEPVGGTSTLEPRQALSVAAYALPACVLMLLVFVVPLGNVIVQSLTAEDTGVFTLAAYERIAQASLFLRVGGTTLIITLLATGFALLLAYPLAYLPGAAAPRVVGR